MTLMTFRSHTHNRPFSILAIALLAAAVATAAMSADPDAAKPGWVVYTNDLGWLRVGTQAEYEEPWQKKQEIWGGNSDEPLGKTLLRGGFDSRDDALRDVCSRLSRVRLQRHGIATPRWTTTGIYEGTEYNLRLDRGYSPDVAIWRGKEYDLNAEIKVLRDFGGITPRLVFGPQYLCHVYKRDTRQGPQDIDQWMCQPNEPEEGGFWIPDAMGFTRHHFYCDKYEGPFRDSFSLAVAMRRHGVDRVKLWPDSLDMYINTADIPENPRDFGEATDPVQPLVDDVKLLDWVIYATELNWLRIGTRTEFETPRPRNQEIWGGNSDQPIPKTLLAEGFASYDHALRELCADLTNVRWQAVRNNEPRRIVLGTYRGKEYRLQLARNPRKLVVSGRGYDYGAERKALAKHGITPQLSFGKQWLVKSLSMGTYSGPVDTNRWMLVGSKPEGDRIRVPDGTGGWFIHTIGPHHGPFTGEFELAGTMKNLGIDSIGLSGGGPTITADAIPDNPRNDGRRTAVPDPVVAKVVPDQAQQGDKFYVTIFGRHIEPGAQVSFGRDIQVEKLTYFGQDPAADSDHDQWLVTIRVADDAEIGPRNVQVRNADGREGAGTNLFEVIEVELDICPFVKLVSPTSEADPGAAGDCNHYRAEQDKHIQEIKRLARQRTGQAQGSARDSKLRELWKQMHQARQEMETAERLYWDAMKHIIGDLTEEQIAAIVESLRERSLCLFRKSQDRLDAWRETTFSPSDDSPYADRQQEYRDTRNALEHTLKLWRSLAGMLRARREFELKVARIARATGENVDLRRPQRNLCDAHLIQGEASLFMSQSMAEFGLQMHDSYGADLRAARTEAERIKISEDATTAFAQHAIITTRYIVGVCSTMFGGAVDFLQKGWNALLGDYYELSTLSADIHKRIDQSRHDFQRKFVAMHRLRNMSDDEIIMMGRIIRDAGPDAMGDELLTLDDDLLWFNDTDGGLLRMAACFDDEYPQLMDDEYRIMLRRAELSLRTMNQTLNVRMGADADTGRFNRWKRLLRPMAIVRTAFAESMHGEFTTRVEFLAEREAQLSMMRNLRPRLEKIEYDLGRLTWYPKTQAMHYALKYKNPYYLRWCMQMRTLESARREQTILARLQDAWDKSETHKLKRMLLLNRVAAMFPMRVEWARFKELEGADQLMMWNWTGAIRSYEEAARINEAIGTGPQPRPGDETASRAARYRGVTTDGVDRLREALGWQRTLDLGIESFEYTGNQGLYSAVFGMLGQMGGKALHAAGIDLGMAAPEAVAAATAPATGLLGRFGTRAYWAGFGKYALGQLNPFLHMFSWDAELSSLWRGMAQTGEELLEEVAAPEISNALVAGFGVDKQWADFIAEAISESAGGVVQTNRTLALQDSIRHQQNLTKWQRLRVNIDLLRERADGRADVIRAIRTLEALYRAEIARNQLQLAIAQEAATAWDFSQLYGQTAPLHDAEQLLRNQCDPMTMSRVEAALQDFDNRLAQATTADERLQIIAEFWRHLPFMDVRELFRGQVRHALSIRSDNLRRELVDIVRSQFFDAHPEYRQWFVGFTIYGAAAHPDWPGYKRLWSDIDVTAILRNDTPQEIREAFKSDFDSFFLERTHLTPEALDVHMFADTMPTFRARTLWSYFVSEATALSNAMRDNPALASAVRDESTHNLELLWRNMVDPERYLMPGNLVFFNYLVKLSGTMHAPELVQVDGRYELREDRAAFDRIYGNLRFESWMGLDIVLDHLNHIAHGREELSNDMFAYSKDLAKYSIRVLLARIIQTPQGMERLNTAQPSEVAQYGGVEAFIVQVAHEIGCETLGISPAHEMLFDEWRMRKEARPFGEIFEARAKMRLSEDSPRLNTYIAEHINQTERFLLESIGATVATQAAYLRQLMSEAAAAEDLTVRRALEAKFREVVCAHAALWTRLRANERRLVITMAPAGAPFWRMIELFSECERLAKEQRGPVDATVIEMWWPAQFLDHDREPQLPAYEGYPSAFAEPVRAPDGSGIWTAATTTTPTSGTDRPLGIRLGRPNRDNGGQPAPTQSPTRGIRPRLPRTNADTGAVPTTDQSGSTPAGDQDRPIFGIPRRR